MHALDGKLYFRGYNGSEDELYVYDPDTGTTAKVASADINDSGYGTYPEYMHALDGKLYFRGNDGSEYELYAYDPDTDATAKVDGADISNIGGGTDPSYMHALDGKLYFEANGELYVYFPDDLTV